MATALDTVKQFNEACQKKDLAEVQKLVHPNYTCVGPMIQWNGPQDLMDMVETCPFVCELQNLEFIASGNKIVQTFDAVHTSPVVFTIRMCDIVTVEDDKVLSEELFFDSSQMPKEAVDAVEQSLQTKKAA